jgi:hypothetical protein
MNQTPTAGLDGAIAPADVLTSDPPAPAAAEPSPAAVALLAARDDDSSDAARDERPFVAGLAIYGAACMTIGVTAPGLTPLVRRRQKRKR